MIVGLTCLGYFTLRVEVSMSWNVNGLKRLANPPPPTFKKIENNVNWLISGAIRTQNLFLVLPSFNNIVCVHSFCLFLRRINTIKDTCIVFWKNVSKACILTVFENIGKCIFLNNISTACILMLFETVWICREINENNPSKACILAVFETIWNCKTSFLKSLRHAFWRYLKRLGNADFC